MKTLIFICSIFFYQFLIGQPITVTEKHLLKAFRPDKKYHIKKRWETCNAEDSFFKKDTIVFFERYDHSCSKRISWEFESSKSFWQKEDEYFESWSEHKVETEEDHFQIKITASKNETLLTVYNSKIQITFVVHELIYDAEIHRKRMTLIRRKS